MGNVVAQFAFQPPSPPTYKESDKIIWLTTTIKDKKKESVQVKIPSIFLKHDASDCVILYSHGNACDLGQMLPYLEMLRSNLKVNVFSYDYVGYGISKPPMKPSEQGCYSSILTAIDYLTNTLKFPTHKIIMYVDV
jgi:hypothetical protein